MFKGTLREPSIVIFDWDDTLVNSGPLHLELTNRLLSEMGVPNLEAKTIAHKDYNSCLRNFFIENGIDPKKI